MAAIRPACAGEPVTAKITHGKAINETCDPIAETICPLHSSKKSRLCHNEAGRAGGVRVFGMAFPGDRDSVLFPGNDEFSMSKIALHGFLLPSAQSAQNPRWVCNPAIEIRTRL